MFVAHRRRRFVRQPLVVMALLACLGIGGFLVIENGDGLRDRAKQAVGATPPVSTIAPRAEATSAPVNGASRNTVAVQVSTDVPRPLPSWQTSAQPAVVAAIRNESLSAYQVQMDRWSCEGQHCVGTLRIPPTVEAGRQGDLSAPANIFESLKAQMARANIEVSLLSIQPSAEGLGVAFQFSPNAASQGRYYTFAEIAAIRLESFQQGRKERDQDHAR